MTGSDFYRSPAFFSAPRVMVGDFELVGISGKFLGEAGEDEVVSFDGEPDFWRAG